MYDVDDNFCGLTFISAKFYFCAVISTIPINFIHWRDNLVIGLFIFSVVRKRVNSK